MGIFDALPTCSGMPGGYDEWRAREPSPDPAERDPSMSRGRRGPGGLSADERRAAEVAERCVWCLGEGPEEPCSEECERTAVRARREQSIAGWSAHCRQIARMARRYRREGDRNSSPRIARCRAAFAETRATIAGLREEMRRDAEVSR